MLHGLGGYLAGFDGQFDFENIGDKYFDPDQGVNVPYVGMRSMPAVFGSLTVGVVYWIMRESGYPMLVAAFSAGLILFGELAFSFPPFPPAASLFELSHRAELFLARSEKS